ncbi:MAG: nitroreductase [Defluviitaleaceae bacterium]|nr:nitroreductase [Defluviitaleaceae bacterium]
MTTREAIQKRKSIRKFDMAPLDDAALEMIREQLKKLVPLYEAIPYTIEIAEKTKGMFNIKAPHYLVFQSKESDGYLENIGFIGQQLDLFLSTNGLGACWLGASKPADRESDGGGMSHVICMAIGRPAEPLHRGISDFKRKPLVEISEGSDPRLEAARLAPSGINAQNWYFIAVDGKIHCYVKKPNPLMKAVIGKMSYIDMGIAICHIAEESESFSFVKDGGAPSKKGLTYVGTVV